MVKPNPFSFMPDIVAATAHIGRDQDIVAWLNQQGIVETQIGINQENMGNTMGRVREARGNRLFQAAELIQSQRKLLYRLLYTWIDEIALWGRE